MSRIFDALQRSGAEQSGVKYPDLVSMATAVFEPPRPQEAVDRPIDNEIPAISEIDKLDPNAILQEDQAEGLAAFPSIEVSVPSSSRIVFFTQPESLAAEKFRFLGVRLRQMRQNRQLKRVLVTSTIPEEGKSLVSVNLAGVLARRKEKVLLIEGDLRRPVLVQEFGMERLPGLAEWLQNGNYKPSNIYHLEGPGLWVMPAGTPPLNPLELMQSGRLSRLMEQLTNLFDWIIVDSPPLLPLADTTVWTRLTDGILLVAREEKTEKKQLQRGLEAIKKSDLLGVVLNGCTDPDHNHYYQRYIPAAEKGN